MSLSELICWAIMINQSTNGHLNIGRKQHTAFLVQVAALCSRAVYRKDPAQVVPELSGYVIKDRHWVEPTCDGSGKAAALFEIAPDTPDFHQKILVIAVRGSASTVDWLVNLNSELTESPGLVVSGLPFSPPARAPMS